MNKACEKFKLDHPESFIEKVFTEVYYTWIKSVKMSEIVNAFCGWGICPLNPKVICPEKIGPLCNFDCAISSSSFMSLKAVIDNMRPEIFQLFLEHYTKGCNVWEDELYVVWTVLERSIE